MLDRADPETTTDGSASLLTRLSNRLFGDPRKAPRRLATLVVFVLFGIIALGFWLILNARVDTSGSSEPVMGPLLQVLTSVWTIPVLAAWFTRRWVFFKRGRYARISASVTGWTEETIKHLREEVQTTDGCTRVISSTEDTQAEIADRIDAALEGDYDDDTVDFWEEVCHADDFDLGHDDFVDDADEETDRLFELTERHGTLVDEYGRKTDRIDALLDDALEGEIDPAKILDADSDAASMVDLMDDDSQAAVNEAEALLEECKQIEQELDAIRAELDELAGSPDDRCTDAATLRENVQTGYRAAIDLSDAVHEVMADPKFEFDYSSDQHESDPANTREDREIPWRVRFHEEIKHLYLDLQSGFRTGDAALKFGVPAGITFVLQVFAVGLWTHPLVYLLFMATSSIIGLSWFWFVKRRRQRRLKSYRADTSRSHWVDCAGQFKRVETADVTAYIGFIAGRRYASYNRDEFVRKTSRTMFQHVSDECVAPSDLEHYARALAQMKPNLQGYRDNILEPEIERDLEETVRGSEDDLIAKAELAWSVIEQPTSSRIEKRLGNDPEIVREEYRYLVEEAHVLDERDVEFVDASGEVQKITLVFPADKNRLPDMSERHSQFSDRFSDRKGDPVYELPEVDPRDSLTGFVPTERAAALFDGADPAEVAEGGA
ncbi:hypothetical protein BB347_17665 (plasmid) [Natronorubrum daqingense]|uniref:Uncharacterized protein n=1 Tax=Natronorubrum daqingense TaxID=588898 RepID=A0A1P8RJ59_9EURY|nr:hypothetical protein BB347_17665 [Natronorubrum daqingense]